jgi:hypothetical protein
VSGLALKPAGGIDFLALGGLVIRLDTGLIPFRKATDRRRRTNHAAASTAMITASTTATTARSWLAIWPNTAIASTGRCLHGGADPGIGAVVR